MRERERERETFSTVEKLNQTCTSRFRLRTASRMMITRLLWISWCRTCLGRVTQLAATPTLNTLKKILLILSAIAAVDVLLECSSSAFVRRLWLLVLRVRLLGHGELLERAMRLFVTKATL